MKTVKYFRLDIIALSLIACVVSASPQGTKPDAKADKAKAEEAYDRELARVAEENKKIAAANEVLSRTFKAGNEALNAGRYDEAIAAYDEGIAVRGEPALYTNRSEALRHRGAERYNTAIQKTDLAARKSGQDAAFKDFKDAAES